MDENASLLNTHQAVRAAKEIKRTNTNINNNIANAIKRWPVSCLLWRLTKDVVNVTDDDCQQQVPTVAVC